MTKISEKDYFNRRTNVENGIWRKCCNSSTNKKNLFLDFGQQNEVIYVCMKYSYDDQVFKNRMIKRVYKYELKLTANIWLISIEDKCY